MKSAPAPVARPANAALPALVLLFDAFIWGTSWLPFRALSEHGSHPLWSTVFVYVCGVALFLVWRPRVLGELARHPKLAALALAAGLTNICFNWAVTVGDVMRVVLLFYLMPAWSILLAWALLGERPTAGALLRLALALAGVTLVLKKPGMAWPWPESQADWLAIAGGFSFALTGVLLRRWRGTPATARTFAMIWAGPGSRLRTPVAAATARRTCPRKRPRSSCWPKWCSPASRPWRWAPLPLPRARWQAAP